jgi:hypothetical protein
MNISALLLAGASGSSCAATMNNGAALAEGPAFNMAQ